MKKIISVFSLLAVSFGVMVYASDVQAQYPTPAGSVVATASATTAQPGAEIKVAGEVTNADGSAAAGVDCVAVVTDQPGSDAHLGATALETDAAGRVFVDLDVGSTPGTVKVQITCGDAVGVVSVSVAAARPPAAPLDAGSGAIVPPATGSAGLK